MNNYKTVKFNGMLYPYVVLDIYDYNKNKDVTLKVSTEDLQDNLIKAFTNSDNKTLQEAAQKFDPDINTFIPRKMLLNDSEEKIIKYIMDNLDND